MTFTEKQITDYINHRIDRMNHTFEWAKENMEERTPSSKARWAKDCIKSEYEDGYGALSFTHIYLEGIDEKTFNELHKRLTDASYDISNQIDDYFLGC